MSNLVTIPKVVGFINPSRFNYASRHVKPKEEKEDTWYNPTLDRFTNIINESDTDYLYVGKFTMSTVFEYAKNRCEVYWY